MLPANEIHLWFLEVDQDNPTNDTTGEAILSAHELERAARFRFPRDRRLFRAAHTFLRETLGRYLHRSPAELTFLVGSHGRPELEGAELRFNLTHTNGFAACVITAQADCGVDAEPIDRRTDIELVSKNVFTDKERSTIQASPESQRANQFFQFWTLKEAYIKARGLGLSLPLKEISFHVDDTEPTVTFGPRIADDPAHWRFWSGMATARHQYAIAIKNSVAISNAEMNLRIYR